MTRRTPAALLAVLLDGPALDGARCIEHPASWWDDDVDGEDERDRTYRLTVALRLCRPCPVREPCARLGERQARPGGVWGGRVLGRRLLDEPTNDTTTTDMETT